jgi:CheY-like chemotaxis protein
MNTSIVDGDLDNLQDKDGIDDKDSVTIDVVVEYVFLKAMCYNPLNYLGLVIALISEKPSNFWRTSVAKKKTSQKVIVTIEDDSQIAELLEIVLNAEQLIVSKCSNGMEGLEAVRAQKPDLVILDVMMPVMSGWQVYDEIRADEAVAQTPILMLSVTRQKVERRQTFRDSKIDFYMNKPFDMLKLRRQVEEILELNIWDLPDPPSIKPIRPDHGDDAESTTQSKNL